MDNATRLQYLDAMGIDVWVERDSVPIDISLSVSRVEFNAEGFVDDKTKPDSWFDLQNEVSDCQKCSLCQSRKQVVFGEGNINADWMLVSDEPDESEELEGKPFAGQVGLLLNEIIRAMGQKRDKVYITNIIKCRPTEDRDAKVDELRTCDDYLQRQIVLLKPKIIIALGRVAAQHLLKTKEPLSKIRGVRREVNGIPLVVIYHPAYLLRSLLEKRKAWHDLQVAINIYQEEK